MANPSKRNPKMDFTIAVKIQLFVDTGNLLVDISLILVTDFFAGSLY
jgi:hypothetical protein